MLYVICLFLIRLYEVHCLAFYRIKVNFLFTICFNSSVALLNVVLGKKKTFWALCVQFELFINNLIYPKLAQLTLTQLTPQWVYKQILFLKDPFLKALIIVIIYCCISTCSLQKKMAYDYLL